MIPICEAFAAPATEVVVFVCGAQMSKTETALNVLGWNLADRHRPCLYIGPTEKNTRSMSLDRVSRMIHSTPALLEGLAGGQRDKVTEKWIHGARLGFGWASSATELASHPAALALVDERDRMSSDVGAEGDPVTLVSGRLKNYRHSTLGIFSTPTLEHASPIWAHWEEGTRGMWAWVCPECSAPFIPRLELLVYDREAPIGEIHATAALACPANGCQLGDEHKPAMNAGGFYLFHGEPNPDEPMRPKGPSREPRPSTIASFWVSGLASPWVTFGQVARELEAATRSAVQERIQGVVNVWGGELYRATGERPDWEEVQACVAEYDQRTVPGPVQVLVMGVDVQRDRLVFCLRGFGHEFESWLVDYGVILGPTDYDDVWVRLGNMIRATYGNQGLTRVLVDSGYKPGSHYRRPESVIYSFCKRFPGTCFPSKGFERMAAPFNMSELKASQVHLATFDADHFKSELYRLIRWPQLEAGAWHVPRGISEDYCRQLVAEEVVIQQSGRRVWLDHRRPNHFFDAEVLCLVAARSLNLEALPPKGELEREQQRAIQEQFDPPPASRPNPFRRYD